MAKIVQTTDFTGKYAVTQNPFTTSKLQSFIEKYEKEYLYDLLGVTLANLFLANIATPFTPPTDPNYLLIFNALDLPINYFNGYYCGSWGVRSNGIKDMLVCFIYFEFIREQAVVNTPTGAVSQQNEVSNNADWNSTTIYNIYNMGIKSFNVIHEYIRQNYTDFTNYRGICKQINHWSI